MRKKLLPPHHERLEPDMPSKRPRRLRNTANTARAIAELEAKATATDFTARIRTYVAAYGVLQHVLSLLYDTIDYAEQIFFTRHSISRRAA